MMTSIDADDYMSTQPLTFTPETDIYDAIHHMLQQRLSGATVLNAQGEVVGIISELDCLKAIINVSYYHQGGGTVGDFMTTDNIEFIDPHLSIVDAAQVLLSKKRRRMPIQKNGKFMGQISARSILQAFKDEMTEHDASEDETV